mgnify:CR=1 FL=1
MDYEKQQAALKKKIGGMKGKGGMSMQRMVKKEGGKDQMMQKRDMLHKLVDEGMDMHATGDMDFKQMTDDLHKSMMAMDGMKMDAEKKSETAVPSNK